MFFLHYFLFKSNDLQLNFIKIIKTKDEEKINHN